MDSRELILRVMLNIVRLSLQDRPSSSTGQKFVEKTIKVEFLRSVDLNTTLRILDITLSLSHWFTLRQCRIMEQSERYAVSQSDVARSDHSMGRKC